ncbi:DUF1837 domain-containing protein [Shewanella xiamenensis]|uniref:DUF1837 domain-containing protein n=1 Tax=Shewanella xiamenensis TaxID=332186 RepID=UPI0021BE9603|nr:DUF1837 domain-containing protein [Shewanella xiamenensis]MCT8869584.1 DUF1837 domain-containing protein [Shewanella xiamenensis]
MPWTSEHSRWLVDTGERLTTANGKEVEVWAFHHEKDEAVLSAWAKHFRNHYCLDTDIDFLRGKQSRKDYLNALKFPCSSTKLGPGIRAGDFGEILVADYLQWRLGFWVPRVRWSSKVVRDESPKGSDVIGFRFRNQDYSTSPEDLLIVFEAKTQFSGSGKNRLQDAINDSAKDHLRVGESLHYIKQKLFEKGSKEQAQLIDRFQNPIDIPYKESFGAAAIISDEYFDANIIVSSNCETIPKYPKSKEHISHPDSENLVLLVIKGPDMMALVHELYRRAADEA